MFLIFLMSVGVKIVAQDYLITNKNEFFKVKVLEISQTEIKYKSFYNLNGPTVVLPKDAVRSIKYENGVVENFETQKESIILEATKSEQDFYELGKQDAYKYYRGYTGAGTGTLLTGLLVSPLIGLIPAFATAGTPPSEISLNYPNSTLMKNPEYARGYTKTSFGVKKERVWSNWFITFGISVAAYTILYTNGYR